MNGAIYDSTFNLFYKLKYAHTYDAMLATPMTAQDVAIGEVTWALIRGLMYAVAFLVVMVLLGLVASPLALLAVPASRCSSGSRPRGRDRGDDLGAQLAGLRPGVRGHHAPVPVQRHVLPHHHLPRAAPDPRGGHAAVPRCHLIER
ncbi:MAG: hypothetical protein R3C32_12395 [Chloroflexota bacterium]